MQIYSSNRDSYLPLIPILLVAMLAPWSVGHTIAVLLLTLCFSVGLQEESYYNMTICTILCLICLSCNLDQAYVEIQHKIKKDLGDSFAAVIHHFTIYLLLFEAIALLVILIESVKKYSKFKSEANDVSQIQW